MLTAAPCPHPALRNKLRRYITQQNVIITHTIRTSPLRRDLSRVQTAAPRPHPALRNKLRRYAPPGIFLLCRRFLIRVRNALL